MGGDFIKTISLVINKEKDPYLENTRRAIEKIQDYAEICVESKYKDELSGITFLEGDELYKNADMIISLGGDGTLLGAARRASLYNKPVMGINFGKLGFLTAIEKEGFFESDFNELMKSARLEKRMMLEAAVIRGGEEIGRHKVLNDVAIVNANFSGLISTDIYIADELLDSFTSDGVVIATPTGSTAYSLAAGGPILYPTMSAFVITPICPHMLDSRPIVLPADKEVITVIREFGKRKASLSADGLEEQSLQPKDIIKIMRSDTSAILVKLKASSFFESLGNKLKGNK